MSFEDATSSGHRLPDGYLAVAISDAQLEAPLKVCVVVRRKAEAAGGHFVSLRDAGLDGRVLLGCVLDAGGHVHDWLEIWVQDLAGLAHSPAVCRQALSNAVLDERWARRFEATCETDPDGVIRTGVETEHPAPAFVDLAAGRVVHPVDSQKNNLPWQLCRDDAALESRGLPPYSRSLHRYLWLSGLGGDSPFVPVTPEAPTNDACRVLEDVVPADKLSPLNPGGGLMLVRRRGEIGWEAFVDLLSGKAWPGVLHGRSPLAVLEAETEGLSGEAAQIADAGRLFLGTQGRWGRLVETFHLKLRLLADAVARSAP